MGNKYHLGIFGLVFATLMILIVSPIAATPTLNSINLSTINTQPSMEYLHVVPGKGNAVLTSIYVFGGAAALPLDVTSDGLSEAESWLLMYGNQTGFETYLNRLPMETRDGLSFMVSYESSAASFDLAGDARLAVESVYGVSLAFSEFNLLNGNDVYTFFAEEDATVFTAVADGVEDIATDGFAALEKASLVTGAPVGWVGYGVQTMFEAGSSRQIAVHGMGFVTPDGITGTGPLTLSTDNLLGVSNITPLTGFGLSRVEIAFPYPIEPTTGGIAPSTTTNPLPHVTGEMVWDLRHPVSFTVPGAGIYSVTFDVGMDAAFPMIRNEMTVDKTLLDAGTLQANFTLTNDGDAPASNVEMRFPLGSDYDLIKNGIDIYKVNSTYVLNDALTSTYNLDLSSSLGGGINYDALTLTGWYGLSASPATRAIWDLGTTSISVYDEVIEIIPGFPQTFTLTISNPGGFPIPIINAINDVIVPALQAIVPSATLVQDLKDGIAAKLPEAFFQAFNEAFNELYVKESKFNLNEGTDGWILEGPVEVSVGPDKVEDQYFLKLNGGDFAVDETKEFSFSIDNIPTAADQLALMEYDLGEDPGLLLPTINVISQVQNYEEVLVYAFDQLGFDGRPLTVGLPNGLKLGFGNDQVPSALSVGMPFTWENVNEFKFFGLSNGLNIQLADDEAVISATVVLDDLDLVYNPGDLKTVKVDLTNLGDLAAENVKVHVMQASLGRDNQLFERYQRLTTLDAGTIAGFGGTWTDSVQVEANSFLGYSPVFAVIEFDSDVGQSGEVVPDFLGEDDTVIFEEGGETHHFTMSTLTGALLLPEDPTAQTPSIAEPLLDITQSVNVDVVTYTVKNVGLADTELTMLQGYQGMTLETSDVTVSVTSVKDILTVETVNVLTIKNMDLNVGDTVVITMKFLNENDGAYLAPAVFSFTTGGQSSLGSAFNLGAVGTGGANPLLSLSAGAAAQEEAQQSATEDSSSAAFSASSSVGASVNVGVDDETKTVGNAGFLGPAAPETLGLMLISVSALIYFRRRK